MVRLLHRIRLPLWLTEIPVSGMFWLHERWGRGAIRWPILRWLLATRMRKPTQEQIALVIQKMKDNGTYDELIRELKPSN